MQTSVGRPRWGTKPEWESDIIAPPSRILGMAEAPYEIEYFAHLECVGVEGFRAELNQLIEAAGKREVVLCCFEALKTPGQFCHRRMFAEWWQSKTGERIEEL